MAPDQLFISADIAVMAVSRFKSIAVDEGKDESQERSLEGYRCRIQVDRALGDSKMALHR